MKKLLNKTLNRWGFYTFAIKVTNLLILLIAQQPHLMLYQLIIRITISIMRQFYLVSVIVKKEVYSK